jgi:hypothetical protein
MTDFKFRFDNYCDKVKYYLIIKLTHIIYYTKKSEDLKETLGEISQVYKLFDENKFKEITEIYQSFNDNDIGTDENGVNPKDFKQHFDIVFEQPTDDEIELTKWIENVTSYMTTNIEKSFKDVYGASYIIVQNFKDPETFKLIQNQWESKSATTTPRQDKLGGRRFTKKQKKIKKRNKTRK